MTLPARGDGRARGQPVPVRQLPPVRRAEPVHLPRDPAPQTTSPGSAGRSPTGSTSPVTSRRCTAEDRDPLSGRETSADGAGPGEAARLRQEDRYAGEGWRLNGQVPGPALRDRWPLHRRGAGVPRRADVRRAADPARRRPRASARLDGRRPARASTARGARGRRRDPAAGRRPADGRDPREAGRMSAALERGAAGAARAEPGRASPVTCGSRAGSAEVGAVDAARHLARAARRCADGRRGGRPAGAASTRSATSTAAGGSGLRFVVPGDDEWPAQVDDLAHAEPLRRQGRGARSVCGCAGPLRLDELARSVAVVGSRSATTYGERRGGRDRRRLWRGRLDGRVGRRVRHRRGGAPGRARRRAARRWPCSPAAPTGPTPRRTQQLLEHLAPSTGPSCPSRRPGARRSSPVPDPQPDHRRAGAGHGGGGGGRAQRCAQHRGLGDPAQPAAAGRPGPGHQRPVRGRPRAAAQRAGHGGDPAEDVLEVVGEAGEHLAAEPRGAERAARPARPAQRQVLEAVPAVRAAPVDSIARIAGLGLGRGRGGARRAARGATWWRRTVGVGGWRGEPGEEGSPS